MAAKKYDFSIEQGTSFRLALIYKDKNKNIIDISNYCARLIWTTDTGITQVFTTDNTDPSLYNFSIDGTEGKIILMLPASITNSFNFAIAKYDLELRSDSDLYTGGGKEVSRLLYGTVTLIRRHSRDTSVVSCNT